MAIFDNEIIVRNRHLILLPSLRNLPLFSKTLEDVDYSTTASVEEDEQKDSPQLLDDAKKRVELIKSLSRKNKKFIKSMDLVVIGNVEEILLSCLRSQDLSEPFLFNINLECKSKLELCRIIATNFYGLSAISFALFNARIKW